jgi:hypothetical protein
MKNKFIIWIAVISFSAATGCNNNKNAGLTMDLKGKKAPQVANPAIELNMPAALATAQTGTESGPAIAAQNTNRFTYQIMSENKKLPDASLLSGTVSELTKTRLAFKTSEGKSILMDYTLPGNQALLLSSNESVSMVKKENVKDASYNKFLILKGNKGIIISSTSQINGSPIQLQLNSGLEIRQGNYDAKKIVSDTKYDTQFSVPVSLLLNGKQIPLDPANPLVFTYNAAKYKLSVFQSRYIVPKKDFQSVSEGQGYFLNYLLLLTE